MPRPQAGDPDRLPVEPFQAAFLRSGMTAGEFARAMGLTRRKTDTRYETRRVYETMDTTRGLRLLGLRPHPSSDGRQSYFKTVSLEDGKKMLRIFPSLDPVDVGF